MIQPDQILVLTGPTGVGKTSVSIEVGKRLGAEIVSCDSRQVFKQIHIGTATPSGEQLAALPHHFVNQLDVGESWSAGEFAAAARERICKIIERGNRPLVVGGSTLYLEALVHGIANIPKVDPMIQSRLKEQMEKDGGANMLYKRLQVVDAAGAATMDSTKTQRIVRALGVYETTGKPWSSFFQERSEDDLSFSVFVLNRPRKELYQRINKRVDVMLANGLLQENKDLLNVGYRLDHNPLRTIGYKEPVSYLAGDSSFDEMVEHIKRNTRRYAKRQLTWFRRHPEYKWLDISTYASVEEVADALLDVS